MPATPYADPEAAAATLAKVEAFSAKIRDLEIPAAALGELAVLTAHTYLDTDQERAREFNARLLAEGDTDDLEFYAIYAMAWTALFGPNGSDAQRAATMTLAWAEEPRDRVTTAA